jgi:hypothetical protein
MTPAELWADAMADVDVARARERKGLSLLSMRRDLASLAQPPAQLAHLAELAGTYARDADRMWARALAGILEALARAPGLDGAQAMQDEARREGARGVDHV